MYKQQLDVQKFHEKAGQIVNTRPSNIDENTAVLRFRLILEELKEFAEAAGLNVSVTIEKITFNIEKQDLVKCADALADLLYVVYGSAVSLGINMEPIWNEVQRSNMSKFIDGYRREDGKWIKGPSYSPAQIAPLIEEQKNS